MRQIARMPRLLRDGMLHIAQSGPEARAGKVATAGTAVVIEFVATSGKTLALATGVRLPSLSKRFPEALR
jgi:hypothetical protein